MQEDVGDETLGDAVQRIVLQIHTRHAMEFVDLTARLHEIAAESPVVC